MSHSGQKIQNRFAKGETDIREEEEEEGESSKTSGTSGDESDCDSMNHIFGDVVAQENSHEKIQKNSILQTQKQETKSIVIHKK